jgi:hypothetical protein
VTVADLKNGMLDIDVPIPEFEGPWALMGQAFKLFVSSFGMIFVLLLILRWPFIFAEFIISMEMQELLGVVTVLIAPFLYVLTYAVLSASLIFYLLHFWKTGESPGLGSSLRWGVQRMWRVSLYLIAYQLLVMLGIVLLVVPGVLFALWYCFTEVLASIEKEKRSDVFIRSKELVVPNIRWLLMPTLLLMLISLLGMVASHYVDTYEIELIWFWPINNLAEGLIGAFGTVMYLLAFVKIAKQNPDIVLGKVDEEKAVEPEVIESA